MNLAAIIPKVNPRLGEAQRSTRDESLFNKIEYGKGIFYDSHNLYENRRYEFYVSLIHLLDRVFTEDNTDFLSDEQTQLIDKYFAEADTVSPPANISLGSWVYDWDSLHRRILDLDTFLGGWLGEEDGEYATYRKKQFHRKRKPFSPVFAGASNPY